MKGTPDSGQGLEKDLSQAEIEALAERVRKAKAIKLELIKRDQENKLSVFVREVYDWQKQLCNGTNRTLALMGANRIGKSKIGALWVAVHATGLYPDWWTGVRHHEPVKAWVAGITAETTRDILQSELLGDPEDGYGTGLIPADLLVGEPRKRIGIPDAIETIYVRHVSGGVSVIVFKSMVQGRETFQGKARHVIWLDEEPKSGDGYDIYSECRTRTMTIHNAQVLVTYTPLMGMNELAKYLIQDAEDRLLVNATWDDAPHLGRAVIESLMKDMKPHEIEARSKGIPVIPDGLIYPFAESQIVCEPFPVPDNWAHVIGMDLGFTSGTTNMLFARDPKTDITYLCGEYHGAGLEREDHARAIERKWGIGIYIAADPSGNRSESDGKKTIKVYKDDLGLNIHLAENAVEMGIERVYNMLRDGKLKIFKNCKGLLQEFRFYQRKDGKVVKKKDHYCDSMRYGVMALKHAKPLYYFRNQKLKTGMSHGTRDQWRPGDTVVGY